MHVLTYFTGKHPHTAKQARLEDFTSASLRRSVEKRSAQRQEEQVERVKSSRVRSIRTRRGWK